MTSRLKNSQLSSLTGDLKKDKQKTVEEEVYAMEIHNIESERLKKTFNRICKSKINNEQSKATLDQSTVKKQNKDRFDKKDLMRILNELGFQYSKPQIDQWIWEVDEDLDQMINQYQFTLMYKRCIFDKVGLQPRNLFNLVQFLMYDLSGRGSITVEDTLELIYVRYVDELQTHIDYIFDKKEKTSDGQERQVKFDQYLRMMRIKDLQNRRRLQEERKTVTKVSLTKEGDK